MNQKILLIIGGLGALLLIYFVSKRGSGATTTLSQVGQVGTAPGKDTTGIELAFKSNIFSTYTNYLKSLAQGEQATKRVEIQSNLEGQRIAAGTTAATLTQAGLTERERLTQQGQTDRAQIFANADVATVGQRSAAELQRLNLQDQFARAQLSKQSQGNALAQILKALGQLGRSSGGGQQQGSQQGSQQSRTRGGRTIGYPRGVGPILTPPFNPDYPALNFPDFSSIFGGMDDYYNPFSDYYDPFYGNGTGGEGIPQLGSSFTEDLLYDPYGSFTEYGDYYGYDPYYGYDGGGGGGLGGYIGGDYYSGSGSDYYDAAFYDYG